MSLMFDVMSVTVIYIKYFSFSDFLERMASPMNPDNFFLGNKRRSLMLCELGKLPSCAVNEEMGENGLPGAGVGEVAGASGGVAGGGEGTGGRMRGSVGSEAVDRALVQHLIHCECLLQVSHWVRDCQICM